MKQIKFRSVFFIFQCNFSHFTYWGFLNHKDEYDKNCFKAPSTANGRIRKYENEFTGLKDKNGKEIYERDIIKIYGYKNEVVEQGEVFWCSFSLRWKVETYGFTKDNNIEIIGNIYEHKHLLK